MLDAWIIERIKEKEKEAERPQIRCPVPNDYPCQDDEKVVESEVKRGIFKINIHGSDDEEEENKTSAA